MKIAICISVIFIASLAAQADEDSAFAEAARLRQYVGGRDEGDLKVQPVLNQSSQSKKKNQSANEPAEGF